MTQKIISLLLLVLLGIIGIGSISLAIGEIPPKTIPSNIASATEFIEVLDGIVDWFFIVVLLGAVIFVIFAAWKFISGGGDPQAVSQARSSLFYAAIGILAAVLAKGIVAAVSNLIVP